MMETFMNLVTMNIGARTTKDMEELSKEPRNIEWLEICDPMQIPLKGESSWKEMELIYFNN
ncbi:MAG: hypothetical protein CM15mP32_4700 [Flavobacteriaceae bacterium]|nr:MAG: hypothetical protein CM15mP32_4700 [Flavobacteriaceae bacterium]